MLLHLLNELNALGLIGSRVSTESITTGKVRVLIIMANIEITVYNDLNLMVRTSNVNFTVARLL